MGSLSLKSFSQKNFWTSVFHRITLCIFFLGTAAQAEIDWDDTAELNRMLWDRPRDLALRADQQIRTTDAEQQPRRWVRLYTVMASAGNLTFDDSLIEGYDPGVQRLKEAIQKAERLGLLDEAFELRSILAFREHPDHYREAIETLVTEARARGAWSPAAYLSTEIAWSYHQERRDTEALRVMEAAYAIATKHPDVQIADKLRIRNDLALLLAYVGQKDRALPLFEELMEGCRQVVLRYFCGIAAYNLGERYREFGPEYQVKEEAAYRESIALASEGGDLSTVGVAWIGLSQLSLRRGQVDQAAQEVDAAILALDDTVDNFWQARGYLQRGLVKAQSRDYRAAKMDLELARKRLGDASKKVALEILEGQVIVERSLGNHLQALQILQEAYSLRKQHEEETRADEQAKATAALGLAVAEQRNLRLEEQLEFQKEKLRAARLQITLGILVMAAALLAIGLMVFALRKAREVKTAKDQIQRILDHIEEGIVTIDPNLKVEGSFSPALNKLLPEVIHTHGTDIMESIFLHAAIDSETKSIIRSSLQAMLGEDLIAWEFNSAQLPLELPWKTGNEPRVVSLDWSPIPDGEQRIQSVLLTLRDITERKALQTRLAEEEAHARELLHKLTELQRADRQRVEILLQDARQIRQLPNHETESKALLRVLHTLKGTARSVGLKSMSVLSHAFEDVIHKAPDQGPEMLARWQLMIDDYASLLGTATSDFLLLRRAPSIWSLIQEREQDAIQLLAGSGLRLQALELQDSFRDWTPSLLQSVDTILLHGITNAIDHGFVRPNKKGYVLAPHVRLIIKAVREGDELVLTLEDNGVGLDLEHLRRLAEQRGFIPEGDQTSADVVFLDGVSTATDLSLSSGRGVGLSAVLAAVQEQKGLVRLRPALQGGACLFVKLPVNIRNLKSA